ncbi:MAG: aconitate hydratase [Thermodesulfobacteriota bacterium]|nr:aconitate hydratase [Thermodesulfobacteriota bacterium]
MGKNLIEKILNSHLVSGQVRRGETIAVSMDQTLLQDVAGTMAALEFEALSLPRIKTQFSIVYIDHNTLQTGFENADDHIFLWAFAQKYGLYFSRAGNGICHQVFLERFAVPGQILLGADSHTPTCGGMGMVAVGLGGLDIALAMAGEPFYFRVPKMVQVRLLGKLSPWVSAKDIILEMLHRFTVKGGVGKAFEYGGPGVKTLTVPERATITNMGAELGATTSIFPSDEMTRAFLRSQQKEADWIPLSPDTDAKYDEVVEIDLENLEPFAAQPHSPDRVCPVKEIEGIRVDQVAIGSCTNSSYRDLMTVARILKGKTVAPNVSLVVSPGSRQVLKMLASNGALSDLIESGARILESACGPCIGMGQAPCTNGVSLRTFNRNFQGRSGTQSSRVYLVSPEVAAVSSIKGVITDPRTFGKPPSIDVPEIFPVEDNMFISPLPPDRAEKIEVFRGPNIKPLPLKEPLPDRLTGRVLIKLADNITTDDIIPGGAKVLPLRSNIPAISEYVFERLDPSFIKRAKELGGGFIVAGDNYGQGSSREHAAIGPMFLGVKAVIAKSFARIHLANLINFGVLPLTFKEEEDYQRIEKGDEIEIEVGDLGDTVILTNKTKNEKILLIVPLDEREKVMMRHGGTLAFVKVNLLVLPRDQNRF